MLRGLQRSQLAVTRLLAPQKPSLRRLSTIAQASDHGIASPSQGTVENAPFLSREEAVHAIMYPGSRILEMSRSATGNYLSSEMTTVLVDKLQSYTSNNQIHCVFFTTESVDSYFCNGVDVKALKRKNVNQNSNTSSSNNDNNNNSNNNTSRSGSETDLVKGIHTLSKLIHGYKKPLLAVCSGKSSGTGIAAFLGSKYRLGTVTTRVSINELHQGIVPMGGLAYHFHRCFGEGSKQMARYLAVSERELDSDDLYHMGLVTHVVEECPEDSLAFALAHTIPQTETKIRQMEPVDNDALEDLLETMHCGSDIDISSSPFWDEMLLVPMSEQKIDDSMVADNDLRKIEPQIIKCFQPDDPEASMALLEQLIASHKAAPAGGEGGGSKNNSHNNNSSSSSIAWAEETLQKMENLHKKNKKALKNWYSLTNLASAPGTTLNDVCEAELKTLHGGDH